MKVQESVLIKDTMDILKLEPATSLICDINKHKLKCEIFVI